MVGGQWPAELLLLIHHKFVFAHASYGRLPWLDSSSGRPGEAWTETGKSEIGNGELLQEPTPYLPV